MIDEKKTKAYHDRVLTGISQNHRKVDYYTRQAERCKRIYILTKNRGGIYRLIHRWAKKKNQHFCKEGTKLALKTLKDGLYPTVTVRQIMWALKMKPIPRERWETVFDRREI